MRIGVWQRIRLRVHTHVLVFAAVALFAGVLLAPLVLLDGPMGLFGIMLLPDTEYAPGYSNWRFLQVREGMSAAEVRALLGEPLSVNEMQSATGGKVWIYSRSPHDTHFRCRVLVFHGSVVTEVHTEFYVD